MLEVAFGALVLAISLLAAFTSQLLSLNLLRAARDSNTATSEITAAIEEVTAHNIDNMTTLFPHGAAVPKYDERVLRDERVVVTYPNLGAGVAPNPLQVVVTLSWTAWNGRPATLTFATMKAR